MHKFAYILCTLPIRNARVLLAAIFALALAFAFAFAGKSCECQGLHLHVAHASFLKFETQFMIPREDLHEQDGPVIFCAGEEKERADGGRGCVGGGGLDLAGGKDCVRLAL